MKFGSMVDLARTPAEVKDKIAESAPIPSLKASVPVYGYGTCIRLDEQDLAKLGIAGDLPDVGDMIHFCAMARVTSASEREEETADGEKKSCRSVELQITHLGLENEDEENAQARQQRFYGSEDKAA